VGNSINWVLVIGGIVCVIAELALGAATGFDLALIGGSLTIGGAIGLLTGSGKTGLLAAGALAFVYLAVLRNWLKVKLTVKEHASNVDAVVGKSALVTQRIKLREPGKVRVGSEIWRAELANEEDSVREAGTTVKVESVEGVTLKVR
jgi:membrane protein implicated in regulation of membrane protease activity